MKIEAGDESLASFFLSIIYKKYIKNVLTNTIPGVKMRPRSGSNPENMEGKKMNSFRPWYKAGERLSLLEYASKMAKGNEIVKVEVINNVYGDAILRVQYKTATERQKQFGLYDLHTTAKRIDKLPKKYQPEYI